jgi:hypothetical protein
LIYECAIRGITVAQDDFTLVVGSNPGMEARNLVIRQHYLTIRGVAADDQPPWANAEGPT